MPLFQEEVLAYHTSLPRVAGMGFFFDDVLYKVVSFSERVLPGASSRRQARPASDAVGDVGDSRSVGRRAGRAGAGRPGAVPRAPAVHTHLRQILRA